MESIIPAFQHYVNTPSDINEHMTTLAYLASMCTSVGEMGVRGIVSTWAFLYGLSKNESDQKKTMICVDIMPTQMDAAIDAGKKEGIDVTFVQGDSASADVLSKPVDLLFIDTWHVYGHLKRELATHHTKALKYIVMHDTESDGIYGESIRLGSDIQRQHEESGYPMEEITKGLKPAVDEFLAEHGDQWQMTHHFPNNNGLTVLSRIV
jgi:hypothetical protein